MEEIEDAGLSQLNALRSHMRLILVHLLKLYGWPDSLSANHWRGAVISFQADAQLRFAPSMPQRIDLAAIFQKALEQISPSKADDKISRLPWPSVCPVSLDDLLSKPLAELEDLMTRRG